MERAVRQALRRQHPSPAPYFPECESHKSYLYRVHTPISHRKGEVTSRPGGVT